MKFAQRSPGFYGWKLVGVVWLLDLFNMGFPFFAGAVINSAMLRQVSMSRATFGLGFTLLNLFVGLPSIAIARSIERWSVRTTFIVGAALIGAGSLWLAIVTAHPWQYVFGYGVLVGTGMGFGTNVPLATIICRWFKRYRGRAMALALTASGIGGFISAPLLGFVVSRNAAGFRAGWMVVASVAGLSIAVAYFFVKERPEDLGQLPDGIQPEPVVPESEQILITTREWQPKEAFRTRTYWLIIVGAIACQYPIFFFVAHWVLFLRGLGYSIASAAWSMSIFTFSNVGGRLLGGYLTDLVPARYVFALGLFCDMIATLLALSLSGSRAVVTIAVALLYGFGFGCSFVCMNTILGNYYSHKAVPVLNGMMMLVSSIACAPAGIVGGWLFDQLGTYRPAFGVNFVLLAFGLVAVLMARML